MTTLEVYDANEAEFDRFMEAYQTVLQLKAGTVLTPEMVSEIQFAFEYERRDQEDKVDVYHNGYRHGLAVAAGADGAALIEKVDDLRTRLHVHEILEKHRAQSKEPGA